MKIDSFPVFSTRPRSSLARVARLGLFATVCAFGAATAMAQLAIGTLAGTAGATGTTDATGSAARFNNPTGIAVDNSGGASTGTVYVTDAANHTIRKITPAGVVTTLAGGGGSNLSGSTDSTGTAARFNGPQGIAIDAAGANLYVADTGNNTIRKIVISSGAVTTVAGTAGTSGSTDATGAAASFSVPIGVALNTGGTILYVADSANYTIRQITLSSGAVVTFAGTAGSSGTTNATGTAARFFLPRGLAADATNLYVADSLNHGIRQIVISSAVVTTLAGTLGTSGSADATGTSATFKNPGAVAVAGANLYVADTGNSTVRQIVISSGVTTTLAGTAGLTGSTDAVSTAARFGSFSLNGIAADGSGNIYLADTNNDTIRKGGATAPAGVGTQPTNQSVAVGGTATFTVAATGNPTPTYQWQIQPGGTGGFSNLSNTGAYSGVTTATLTVTSVTSGMNNDKFQCVITNNTGSTNTVTSNAVSLTVTQAPAFTSTASTQFSVGVAGTYNVTASGSPAPTFSITGGSNPASVGVTLASNGVLSGTPTSTTGSPFNFTITATNGSGSVTQAFTLTIQNGAAITTQPSNQTVIAGTAANFTVVASGTPSTFTYQWYRQAAGTSGFFALSNDSTYNGVTSATLSVGNIGGTTLSMNGDQFQVVVNNGVGVPATSTAATLTVAQAPVITSLNNTSFGVGIAGSFQFQATGSPAPTFSITSGANPASVGVTLSSSGLLSGTPSSTTGAPFVFNVTATNVAGSNTQSFTLNIGAAGAGPSVTTQPTSQTVSIGQTATFSVVATGSPAPTYQWQRAPSGTSTFSNITDGGAYSGSITPTLTVTNAATGMSGDLFICVLANTGGTATTNTVTLTVNVGTIVTTIAGVPGIAGSTDGTGTGALFSSPSAIALDGQGNAYVADSVNSVIRKVTPSGVVTTYAGAAGIAGATDGPSASARFNGPFGVAVDGSGNVYVADTFNHTIRVISTGGNVTTLAGTAGAIGSTDDTGALARFAYPSGIAMAPNGTLYVADSANHTIRSVTNSGVVATVAGSPGVRGTADGTVNVGASIGTARFANPSAVATDTSGNIYVADTFNHAIRKITVFGVTTLAGTAGTSGTVDGTGAAARFNQPNGIASDAAGNIYVADTFNDTIRKITSGGIVTTLAGLAGTPGSSDGTGSAARFNQPYGIAVDGSGNILIVDTKNHTIRRSGTVFAPTITTQPTSKAVAAGGTVTFTVAATGSPAPGYQWQRQPAGTFGFVNLSNDGTYSGVTTATLTIFNTTTLMNGDQFQCVASNFISPDAISNIVSLSTTAVPPSFTSGTIATFNVGQNNTFVVSAAGTPAPTFTATGLPSWATLDANSGILSGNPPDASGSPFAIVVTANNGTTATQNLTLAVVVPATAPVITTQPAALAVNRGANATFSVTAAGTAPLSYQWSRNGDALSGATGSTLTLSNVQAVNVGSYTVRITNSVGNVTSSAVGLFVNLPPTITSQPGAQAALVGTAATFTVVATGEPAPNYQWRFNGANLAGATNSTLTVAGLTASSAGNYDVVVTNSLGSVTSSLAQLTVASASSVPVFTTVPANTIGVVNGSITLTAAATGVPAPNYQWRQNGLPISNATSPTLTLNGVLPSNGGNYDVVATNAAGSTTSTAAVVKIVLRSYAGIYTGTVGNGGSFALYVRHDNTAVLLGVLSGATSGLGSTAVAVGDGGEFTYTASGAIVSASISPTGTVSGSVSGAINGAIAGSRVPDIGATQGLAGFYQAGVTNGSGTALAIVGATGQIYVVTQTGANVDGGLATLDGNNRGTVVTSTGSITATVAADGSTLTVTGVRNSAATNFSGANEAIIGAQRLGNISTRARVDTGANIAIAGFVIVGQNSKPVLIRAIGPTLSTFGVTSALAAPKLELFRAGTTAAIASNIGWANAGNTAAIVAATVQAGAFALPNASADSVIFATLPPGAYTAQVSAASGNAGVALIEVYDLSAIAAGQKLFNISTRATAGSGGDNTLIAGIYVAGTAPKRVLIRAVGPGLTQFGLTGVLAAPQLQLVKDGAVVASNTGLITSADAAAIAAASVQVGAFPIPSNGFDSALLVNLAPGSYSATVSGANSTSGIAIVEVYEVP